MSFKMSGQILEIFEKQQVSEKFAKREFVLITDGQYAQKPIFQVVNDKCELLDKFKVGQKVEVSFNLNGKSWTSPTGETKYFNTLDCWKIEQLNVQAPPPSVEAPPIDDVTF